jgi:hypothetical protein
MIAGSHVSNLHAPAVRNATGRPICALPSLLHLVRDAFAASGAEGGWLPGSRCSAGERSGVLDTNGLAKRGGHAGLYERGSP